MARCRAHSTFRASSDGSSWSVDWGSDRGDSYVIVRDHFALKADGSQTATCVLSCAMVDLAALLVLLARLGTMLS